MSRERRAGTRGGRHLVATGARAAERRLLNEVEGLLARSPSADLLARPIVVVVPSRTLRAHLGARLVAGRGAAVAGVKIVTLFGLALEILDRTGATAHAGAEVLPVLVERAVRGERDLRGLVDSLDDALPPVVAAVRDLLDAGAQGAHIDALDELLGELPPADAAVGRARALLRIARAVTAAVERLRVGVPSTILRDATDALRSDPDGALPARAVFVHGFSDATGVAADLIQALMRLSGARVIRVAPPDPGAPARREEGGAFGHWFRFRLDAERAPELLGDEEAPPAVAAFCAPGSHPETREVARRIRDLLERGVAPEAIGVVARDLEPYRIALRVHFDRLGIPFSTAGARPLATPASRRIEALLEVLSRGPDAPVDAWLAAAARPGTRWVDVRVGLRTCGASRLADVANLALADVLKDATALSLPLRRGLEAVAGDAENDEGRPVAPRRKLARAELERVVNAAAATLAALRPSSSPMPGSDHARAVRRLIAGPLGWREDDAGSGETEEALARLAAALPPELALDRDEFVGLLAAQLQEAGRARLGGDAGVRVMGVTEARALTFAHLFLVGLNRDAFPRQVREDPLLPDRVRLALEPLLPDLPVKSRGHDEERFLFAHLLSASDHVTISWRTADDEGKDEVPSPLVEQLRVAGALPAVAKAPDLTDPASGGARPAHERALLAGLSAGRAGFAAVLPLAVAEARRAPDAALATARLAVLDELDPDRRSAAGRARWAELGPYFGFLGAAGSGADPRTGDPAVTTLEGLAGCGWQTFLQRLLRLEPSSDPLAGVPSLDPMLVGGVVHAVLQRIVEDGGGSRTSLEEALAGEARTVPWPSPGALAELTGRVAGEAARAAGFVLPGFAELLARRAQPLLEAARETDWAAAGGAPAVAGVEVDARLDLSVPAARRVAFRADRVDRVGDRVRLTDYKSGRPGLPADAERRRRQLLREVAGGARLQAAAYALAVAGRAEGRYLFLGPNPEKRPREGALDSGDAALAPAFATAVVTLFAAWDRGVFFPRLVDPARGTEPGRCGWCDVREACLRRDSGARRRLAEWVGRHGEGGGEPAADGAAAALLALWRLPLGEAAESADAGEGA